MNLQQYVLEGKTKDLFALKNVIQSAGWSVQYNPSGMFTTSLKRNPELEDKLPKLPCSKSGIGQCLWIIYGSEEELAGLLMKVYENSFSFTPMGFSKKLPGFMIFNLMKKEA